MISFLKGIVESISYDYIEVDVSGVGYLVYVSSPDCYSLYQPVKIPTYMQVKEDDMVLYGFVNREEKELFLKLISVKGVGPKSAISMLSKASPDSIIQAIETRVWVPEENRPRAVEGRCSEYVHVCVCLHTHAIG